MSKLKKIFLITCVAGGIVCAFPLATKIHQATCNHVWKNVEETIHSNEKGHYETICVKSPVNELRMITPTRFETYHQPAVYETKYIVDAEATDKTVDVKKCIYCGKEAA